MAYFVIVLTLKLWKTPLINDEEFGSKYPCLTGTQARAMLSTLGLCQYIKTAFPGGKIFFSNHCGYFITYMNQSLDLRKYLFGIFLKYYIFLLPY